MIQKIWKTVMADELARNREEVNRENRLAFRLLAIVGLPLSIANMIVQLVLAGDTELLVFFLRTIWVPAYFVLLLVLDRKLIPRDYDHATVLLYAVEAPVLVGSILLGSIWDPEHQAITFFIFLMAMPTFILDRPIRVAIIFTGWTVLFLGMCYFVKPPDVFERDLVHAFEFWMAAMAVANVVISIRMVALKRLKESQHHLEHDELTDMRNRRSLERHLNGYLGKPITVIVAELDQLAMYNDFYGREAGNQLLMAFAAVMSDVFGSCRSYRYGGDAVLCVVERRSEQDCLALVEECRARFDAYELVGSTVPQTFAVGYTMGTPSTDDRFQQMAQLAEIYAHKAGSRGRGQTFGGAFDEEQLRAAIVESNIETHVRGYETNQLTGLPSISFFISRADEVLSGLVKESRDPMIGLIALPCIKAYNNEFGYAQGDELIKRTAELLREAFPGRLICCISGSQFGIMCYKDEIDPGMQALDSELRAYKEGFAVVCKAGFARHDKSEGAISLLDKARVAERSIRDQDGVLYRFYDEQLDADVKFREYIVSHLDEAIEQGYLEVYYQPIIRTVSGSICDEEALSRWNDPERGMLPPRRFIPPLEESRQVYKLSLNVVRQVLADFKRKKELGLALIPVSVNLSRHDFEQCDIVQEIADLVDASGFPHDLIRIEITESAFTDNQEFLKREVARFRESGFEVWMDDFGSEYSTLNLLKDLDVDLIKLDMAFMRSSSESGKNLIIVQSIIDMAKRMGTATLVEGVETEEHMEILRAMGSDKLQGFLFSKPLPLQEIIDIAQNAPILTSEH